MRHVKLSEYRGRYITLRHYCVYPSGSLYSTAEHEQRYMGVLVVAQRLTRIASVVTGDHYEQVVPGRSLPEPVNQSSECIVYIGE